MIPEINIRISFPSGGERASPAAGVAVNGVEIEPPEVPAEIAMDTDDIPPPPTPEETLGDTTVSADIPPPDAAGESDADVFGPPPED